MPSPKKANKAVDPQQLVPDEDKAGKDAPFVSDDYNKVARAAKLEAIVLISSGFKMNRNFFGVRRDADGLKYSFGCEIADYLYDSEEGNASCSWQWDVSAHLGRTKMLSIQATYLVIYSNLKGCNEEAVKRFLQRVGRFATYPYLRAHVSQVSWESHSNIPMLPSIAS